MSMEFGKRLKQLRIEKGLTQKQLAEKLNVLNTAISNWETSISEPSLDMVKEIVAFFETTSDYLLGIDN